MWGLFSWMKAYVCVKHHDMKSYGGVKVNPHAFSFLEVGGCERADKRAWGTKILRSNWEGVLPGPQGRSGCGSEEYSYQCHSRISNLVINRCIAVHIGRIFNPLKLSGNYMNHLLKDSVTQHFACSVCLWVSYDSQNKQGWFSKQH
jgi:hypothetical protein